MLHHVAIQPNDLERSLQFYRDGIGLQVLLDKVFDGPFQKLFKFPANRLRSILLGDPRQRHAGLIELIAFDVPSKLPTAFQPSTAILLLSFWVNITEVGARLKDLGFSDSLVVVDIDGVSVGSVRDPDHLLIELIQNSVVETS
jgi:catechol 2,3-dioxygenase-like lactoylglutathione lyase family enzyme